MSYQAGLAGPEERAELFAERREREVRPRFRGAVATLAALLVMGFFAGGLWLAYHEGLRHATGGGAGAGSGEVPLIRADERPTKVKPEKPGGMEIPDRDKLIYTQKRAAVEHLLPPPEKPMARPGTPSAAVQPEPLPLSAAPANAPGAATSAPAAAMPAEPQQIAAKPSTKAAPESPGAAKSASLQSSPAKTGATRIQLGSVHSEDAARQEWDRIKRTNSDLLGSLSATPVRADLGDKGVFYRIQTGPIADAERLCGELRRRNVGCIIAR
jgi:SPOR domain